AFHLVGVDALHFLEQFELVANLLGNLDERAQILRKTTAAKTDAGVEETAANALVQADAVSDFLHVRVGGFADVGDGVDVGNFQREKGIRRVLDEFRRVDVGDDDGRVERRISLRHRGDGTLRADANDDAVGIHQIADGKTFAQKLRIADHDELHPSGAVALDGLGHFFARLHRHGAFVHHDLVTRDGSGDVTGNALYVTQIHRAIGLRRRRHRDENDIGMLHALGGAGGELEPSRSNILFDEFFQTGFVNRDATGLKRFDLGRVIIHADDVVTDFRKTGARDKAD